MFETKVAPWPVERTLLVTGALDALMTSHAEDCGRIETPHLSAIAYPAPLGDRIVPTRPRASGAAIVASAEFRADYTTLFSQQWLAGGTDGKSTSDERGETYPDKPPLASLQSRAGVTKL